MTSHPYDGLIEDIADHLCARRPCGETPENVKDWLAYSLERCGLSLIKSEALSRLTRDVEEAKAALEKVAGGSIPGASTFAVQQDWRGFVTATQGFADATLTRLSRPTELDADPAFVASQSSRSVSTKGFNRGERGDGN